MVENKSVKIAAKILGIGKAETSKTGKGYAKFALEKLDTKEEMIVSVFLGNAGYDDIPFSVGDEVEIEVQAGEWKNKYGKKMISYSSGLWLMTPLKKPELPKATEDDGVDWEGKERRGHRRACLAIAASILTDEMKNELGKPDVEVVGMVQLMANKLVDYVYDEVDGVDVDSPII